MVGVLSKASGVLGKALGLLLIAGVVLNFSNAFLRFAMGSNIVWAEEMMTYGLIVIIMLGTVCTTIAKDHLGMDAVVQVLSNRPRAWLALFSHVVLAAICIYLAMQSWTVVAMMLRMGQTSVAARIPMWIPHSAFLISFVLCALSSMVLALRQLLLWIGSASERKQFA